VLTEGRCRGPRLLGQFASCSAEPCWIGEGNPHLGCLAIDAEAVFGNLLIVVVRMRQVEGIGADMDPRKTGRMPSAAGWVAV
jgi:hypothetical protein